MKPKKRLVSVEETVDDMSETAVVVDADMHPSSSVKPSDAQLDRLPKILASSNKGARQKGLQALEKWLTSKEASEEDLKRIWKGLFYAVWHADKAPVQEELIERVAGLMLALKSEAASRFLQVFLWTMRREWSGIDRLRLDKFYLLLRTFLRTTLECMRRAKWDPRLVATLMDVYGRAMFEAKDKHAALGIYLHFADTFLEEANRFAVPAAAAQLLLEPFLQVLSHSADKVLLPRVESAVFGALVDEQQQDEDADSHLFSRAVDLGQLASRLFALASAPEVAPKNRAALYAVHSCLKKAGLDALLQNGGDAVEDASPVEDPPVKENGKRAAGKGEKEKSRKKRKVEIVIFGEAVEGGLTAGDFETGDGQGKKTRGEGISGEEEPSHVEELGPSDGVVDAKKKRAKKGSRDGENHAAAENVTSEGSEKKTGKGKKKGKEALGVAESNGTDSGGATTGEELQGGDILAGRDGGGERVRRHKGGANGSSSAAAVENGNDGKGTTRRGKRKADGIVVGSDGAVEAEALEKKGGKSRATGGAGEGETDPPGKKKKKKRAADGDAVAFGEGGAFEQVEVLQASSPEAETPVVSGGKKKRRKDAVAADVAADVGTPADVAAADVSFVGGGKEAVATRAGKGKRAKVKKGGSGSASEAVAAIESALLELRGATEGLPPVMPPVTFEASPAVIDGTPVAKGKKKKRAKGGDSDGLANQVAPPVTAADVPGVTLVNAEKKRVKGGLKKLAGGAAVTEPGTPTGDVGADGATVEENGEAESAAKRRKSGAGATPAIAPKPAAASNIGKSRFAPVTSDGSGGANLAVRFASTDGDDAPLQDVRKLRNRQSEMVSAAPQNPEAGPSLAAVTPQPLTSRGSARRNTPGSTEASGKKKVRFVLKNNLEFKVGSPLPEKTTRTPPAATPRGSALKVTGPSPIRKMGASLVDGYAIGSRRNKKDRRSPARIHISGSSVRGGARGRGRGGARGGRPRVTIRYVAR